MLDGDSYLAQLTERDRREYLRRIKDEPGLIELAVRGVVSGTGHVLKATGELLIEASQREPQERAAAPLTANPTINRPAGA